MADTIDAARRSWNMSRIRSENTSPEIAVRRALHAMGLRFRLHRRDLPGRPDVVLAKHHAVVFVHGCFWHGHICIDGHIPKSRTEYWVQKIARNVERNAASIRSLRRDGWRVLAVWECQTKPVEAERLKKRLARFFGS